MNNKSLSPSSGSLMYILRYSRLSWKRQATHGCGVEEIWAGPESTHETPHVESEFHAAYRYINL